MRLIDSFRNLYGGFYGILLFSAYLYFMLTGAIWLYEFPGISALIFVAVFGVQMYFKNKLANLIIGVILLFMSIGLLLQQLSLYEKPAGGDSLMLGFAILNILGSGVLIFSFLQAFLQKE
ncbi:hypothetical protein ACTHGU_05910 [Chitinophagaceae bacterium MMS25-I14]